MTDASQAGAPILHGTLIAARRSGRWRGVLLEGVSGAGKSDLALRAMQTGWRLVADDRVLLWTSGGRLFGRAPDTLRGLLEVRGLGVAPTPILDRAEITSIVGCVRDPDGLERVPEPARRDILGVSLPLLRLHALESSALAKLELALKTAPFDSGPGRRI